MSASTTVPKAKRTTRSKSFRYAAAVLAFFCVVYIGYAGIRIVKDFRLVEAAFPSLPAEYTTDVDMAILFSGMMLPLDHLENSFLYGIRYPPSTIPNDTFSPGNPIADAIYKAQKEQGLVLLDGAVPLPEIMQLKQSSIEAVGRAVYLSQERPVARRAFEDGKGILHPDAAFEREPAVSQLRHIFEMAYGPKALEQIARPDK